MSSALAALYNAAPIVLWVEDLTTRAYLDAVWLHDPRIALLVGGGHETLAAAVEDARRSGRTSIYSLRDRDFGPTNRPRWRDPTVSNFALQTFEVECFLLDPPALARCAVNTAGKDEAWIRAHLEQQARDLLWWMACRAAIAGLRDARQREFPAHPGRAAVTSRKEAEDFLLKNRWVESTVPELKNLIEPDQLRERLDTNHRKYADHLERGAWIEHFSGKELIADLVGRIYTKGRPPGDASRQDLAKAVAAQQIASGAVPAELQELKQVLLARLT